MNLTTKKLRQIIKEELRLLTESTGIPELDSLLAQNDVESIIQGLELADVAGISVDYQLLLINKSEKFLKTLARSTAGSQMPELLHHIAKVATFLTTRISIARNPMALPKTLEILARLKGSNGANIAALVAKNPSVPIKVLVELSQHKAWTVRSTVARQTKTPNEILMNLVADHNPLVARYAELALENKVEEVINEEMRSLLDESDELHQMAQLISGKDITSIKQGLNQVTDMADMLGIRLVDIIDDPAASYYLQALKAWIKEIVLLYKKYHSKNLDPTKFNQYARENYAEDASDVIQRFRHLPFINLLRGYSEPSLFSRDIYDITDTWAHSFSADVLLRIGRDKVEISSFDYYGYPARTPKPGENAFATAYNSTGGWLAKIMPMMKQDEILSQLLEELT